MKSITIHNMDEMLAQGVQSYAEEHQMSLNQALKELLSKSLNLDTDKEARRRVFQRFSGVWSDKEFNEFSASMVEFGRVDKADWA